MASKGKAAGIALATVDDVASLNGPAMPGDSLRRVEEFVQNYWIGLGDTTLIPTGNPFAERSFEDIENPAKFVLGLMRRPENFYFTCKHLLNRTISPQQSVLLWMLWRHAFPMLLGTRGLSKCVVGDTLVATNEGIHEIKTVADGPVGLPHAKAGLTICGEGGYKDVAYAWNNGEGPTIKVTTDFAYELEGTPNHPVRVVSGDGHIQWKNLEDVSVGDIAIIDRNPEQKWHSPEVDLDERTAYLFGLLTGDGGYTVPGTLTFTNKDQELVDAVSAESMRLWGKPFRRQPSSKYGYRICGVAIYKELYERYGWGSSECGKKCFPTSVLRAGPKAVAAYIRGLMDTDGTVTGANASCTSKSRTLMRTLQFCLTRLGVASAFRRRFNKKYQRWYYQVLISGSSLRVYQERIGFGLTEKKIKLAKACAKKVNDNKDVIPRPVYLNLALKLRDEFFAVAPPVRGSGRRLKGKLSPHRLKEYQLTYPRLRMLLDLTRQCAESDAWKKLDEIYRNHYLYDPVVKVERGRAVTYDVNVPDGHSFLSNGFVSHNSFCLALYCMLRALFCQGSKIIIVGAAFRQAKVVTDYCAAIWQSAPILRDLVGSGKGNGPHFEADRCTMQLGDSIIIGLPMGTGEKIRGQRANITVAEEFGSIPIDIFETVVSGFANVSLSPIEKMQTHGRHEAMKTLGIETPKEANYISGLNSNQTILSGTASYRFNHFFKYWERYKSIIETRGDKAKLAELAGDSGESINCRDYCIIRIPYELVPKGFMDEKNIARARMTLDKNRYKMEMSALFPRDSDGFFKRSLIETCVVGKPDNPIELPSCGLVDFSAVLRGERDHIHVMGVDPASESDNFAIVIVEVWPDHRRVVYCWTTTRKRHKLRLAKNLAKEHDYYNYVGRKIRDLTRQFRIAHIAMDKQGGGVSVLENLTDPERCKEGEIPILPVIVKGDEQPTDHMAGAHILELCSFAKADWVSGANHGMKKDLESKVLLFPSFNSATIGLAMEEDRAMGRIQTNEEGEEERLYDTLEDCALDIEELKEELASIVHTQVGTSRRDHWDTPVGQSQLGKKVRTRKDRYSALLMANMAARCIALTPATQEYLVTGGFADDLRHAAPAQPKSRHQNPYWYEAAVGADYGAVVKHR